MKNHVKITHKNSDVTVENGELISFKVDEKEYIHQKGNKGWRNSDIEMFPVIGPTSKNNFRVHTKKGAAIQDQHGLLRELKYSLVSSDETAVKFIKKYKKNTKIPNSKFPKKSTEAFLSWPFDFTFEKQFTLENKSLKIVFIITSEKGMPFMLGYHPAFLLSNTGKEIIASANERVTLADVYKAGHNAYPLLNCTSLILENSDKNNLEISTVGFHNFMLWTAVDNMLCIEPISQYTSYTNEKFSEENMSLSKGKDEFSIEINVLDFE
jgi:galactose mutarotase-like enzyme